ncbi:MAG: DUF3108 domain-containing protein [Pseudomonadota bacterium]
MISQPARTLAIALGLPTLVAISIAPASAADWPSQVIAKYDVAFAGFRIGSFNFRSDVGGKSYSLAGEAKVSAVFGAFKWRGFTRSSGQAVKNGPLPQNYAFDFQSNSKRGSVRLAFQKRRIVRSEVIPNKPYSNQHVPLLAQHLKNVFDPISAVMALTKVRNGEHPCRRRIPIFDGKQRFDLVLSPAGREQVRERRPSGQPDLAYVCRVNYVPLGGFKKNRQTQYMASNNNMRVVLRAVPSANIYIPYQVRVPTIAGEAVLSSRQVNIVTAQRQRIALIH